jgi:hypothetical protein
MVSKKNSRHVVEPDFSLDLFFFHCRYPTQETPKNVDTANIFLSTLHKVLLHYRISNYIFRINVKLICEKIFRN